MYIHFLLCCFEASSLKQPTDAAHWTAFFFHFDSVVEPKKSSNEQNINNSNNKKWPRNINPTSSTFFGRNLAIFCSSLGSHIFRCLATKRQSGSGSRCFLSNVQMTSYMYWRTSGDTIVFWLVVVSSLGTAILQMQGSNPENGYLRIERVLLELFMLNMRHRFFYLNLRHWKTKARKSQMKIKMSDVFDNNTHLNFTDSRGK